MNKSIRNAMIVGVTTVTAVSLTACSGGSAAKKEATGYLEAYEAGTLNTIDPVLAEWQQDKSVITNTQLMLADLTEDGKFELQGAESFTASEDQKTFTIKVRSGLKWSNGDALTAKDYAYGYQAIKDSEKSTYKYIFDTLDSAEASDDSTLVLKFNVPRPLFETTDLSGVAPINEKFYKEVGGEGKYGTSAETTLSSGAFVLEGWDSAQDTTWNLKKNDNYFDAGNVVIKGVNFRSIVDPKTVELEFKNKKVDYLELRGQTLHNAYASSNKYVGKQGTIYFLQQGKNENLENQNLRLALSKSINREDIVTVAPGYTPAEFYIPKYSLVDKGGKDIRDYDNAKLESLQNDDEAKKLWETAQAELGTSEITLKYLVFEDAQNVAVAQVIKDKIEKTLPGVTIEINAKDSASYTQLQADGNFDLLFMGWASIGDPVSMFYPFIDNEWNKSGVVNPEVSDSVTKIDTMLAENPQDIEAAFNQALTAEKSIIESGQAIPLYQKAQTFALSDKVQKYYTDILGRPIYRHFEISE